MKNVKKIFIVILIKLLKKSRKQIEVNDKDPHLSQSGKELEIGGRVFLRSEKTIPYGFYSNRYSDKYRFL